jgi:hypothetical protein
MSHSSSVRNIWCWADRRRVARIPCLPSVRLAASSSLLDLIRGMRTRPSSSSSSDVESVAEGEMAIRGGAASVLHIIADSDRVQRCPSPERIEAEGSGIRIISSVSKVLASITWNREVCYGQSNVRQFRRHIWGLRKRTSVNVMISLPSQPVGENLMLLIPQPGALDPPLLQSHRSSSYNHPLASPVDRLSLPLLLSVPKTFSGFELRTSHTTATPS